MRIFNTLPATSEVFQELLTNPGKIFELMALDMKSITEKTLSDLLKEELTQFLGKSLHIQYKISFSSCYEISQEMHHKTYTFVS